MWDSFLGADWASLFWQTAVDMVPIIGVFALIDCVLLLVSDALRVGA